MVTPCDLLSLRSCRPSPCSVPSPVTCLSRLWYVLKSTLDRSANHELITQLSMFGPVSQYHQNSAFYSSIPPPRDFVTDLVPITVQMPVYKVGPH